MDLFEYRGLKIRWLNHHAAFLVEAHGQSIYVDPWELPANENRGAGSELPKADLVLVTHSHYDHFSIEDIRKISNEKTMLIAPKDCIDRIGTEMQGAFAGGNLVTAERNKNIEVVWIDVLPVPAYNAKEERKKFHPQQNNWVGYVLDINNVKLYFAGDTDFIEEMRQVGKPSKDDSSGGKIDIAFLPCGGTYTMDSGEAAEACNTIKPEAAVPMHWGKIVGKREDADHFAEKSNSNVIVLG